MRERVPYGAYSARIAGKGAGSMAVVRREIDTHTVEWQSERGSVRVSNPIALVVITRSRGHLSSELVPPVMEQFDRLRRAGRIHVFHDWSDLVGYDTESRVRLTEWLLRTRREYGSNHILTQSKFVAIGVGVANLVLHNAIRLYDDRARFDARIASTLAEHGGNTTAPTASV